MRAPSHPASPHLDMLRTQIARLEGGRLSQAIQGDVVRFGIVAMDTALLGGGLARGMLHEVAGSGLDIEHAAAASLFIGGILAQIPGFVLWAMEQADLFAPALAAVGLHPDRVIYAEVGKAAQVLLVMEDGLRHGGLAAVVGEVRGRFGLTVSRRLQLAAAASGTMALVLRRARAADDPALSEPCAAATRWRVDCLPSNAKPGAEPGRARWRVDLVRGRGAEPMGWILEGCDAQGHLAVPADLADRPAAPRRRHGRAATG